ncbi:hypothetical protein [Halocatena halophila]|uniref:hypothetical protein n=1 Tax=Halocatena halophila TaxID=2814576 RepID=UPI002ED6453E
MDQTSPPSLPERIDGLFWGGSELALGLGAILIDTELSELAVLLWSGCWSILGLLTIAGQFISVDYPRLEWVGLVIASWLVAFLWQDTTHGMVAFVAIIGAAGFTLLVLVSAMRTTERIP